MKFWGKPLERGFPQITQMLIIEDLHAYYGRVHALRGVDVGVSEGSIVAIVGANGAGKTTLLKTVSGLLTASKGRIYFRGRDVTHLSAEHLVSLGISLVPEGRGIFTNLTVEDNLLLGAYHRWRGKGEMRGEMEEVFALFPILKERRNQRGGTLSGGEQQMLAIGRALMSRPRLLLLDEPSMGLAPLMVREIFHIIDELHKRGTTILLVEQNARMSLSLAQRGYVLQTGRVVLTGTGRELLAQEDFLSKYLGEM